MKLEFWYADMVRFLRNASEYGSYNQILLEKMRPFLDPGMRICDAGSGLGYLSLALAPHVRQVTAVEKNPDAANVLKENCLRSGISNIDARCEDMCRHQPEEPYDAMVFCFFGQPRQILQLAGKLCRGRVFVFTRNYRNHRFSAGTHATNWESFPELQALLREYGIEAHTEVFLAEYGQPFQNWEDARRFFEVYSKDPDKSVITEDFLKQKVIETGKEDFPLYMPHERNVAFVTFQAKDIPNIFG